MKVLCRLIGHVLLICFWISTAYAQDWSRASLRSDGRQGDNHSHNPSISADGRYVAFDSIARNLVPGDTNNDSDIFVHDRVTTVTTRVSVSSSGKQGKGKSVFASISSDGRYIAFQSKADNIVSGDKNRAQDIFVHDRVSGVTELISLDSNEKQSSGHGYHPSISGDGRYVAFESEGKLASGNRLGQTNIYVRDRHLGTTSVASRPVKVDNRLSSADSPRISYNGRFVVFVSLASNLVTNDRNNNRDVFVYDQHSGKVSRVSYDLDGSEVSSFVDNPTISADGRYLAYEIYTDDIQIHLYDRKKRTSISQPIS